MKFLVVLFLLTFTLSSFAQTGSKQGTISIKKKSMEVEGLYLRTTKITNATIEDLQNDTNRYPQRLKFRLKEEFYLYFLPNGTVYQIESGLKKEKIAELAKSDPATLRPVLANYKMIDSTLLVIPMQGGIADGMEPVKAYYEGGFSGEKLILGKRELRDVYIFEPIITKRKEDN